MTQIPEYERGYKDALKAAITALSSEADTMNEAHARGIWNSAAFLISCLLRDYKQRVRK